MENSIGSVRSKCGYGRLGGEVTPIYGQLGIKWYVDR
jgi:hypothetical protein